MAQQNNQICLVCKEIVSPLYDFSCEHQICPRCLIRHMFINNMKDFEKKEKKNNKMFKM